MQTQITNKETPTMNDIYTTSEVMQGLDFLHDLVHESEAKDIYELLEYAEKVTAKTFNIDIKGE